MPSLRHIPLAEAALIEFYDQQAEKHHNRFVYPSNFQTRHYDEGANDDSNSTPETILNRVSSANNEKSSAVNYAADCFAGRKKDICAYTDRSNYNDTKRGEEGYLSDTILDEVLNCDYTSCTSETRDHTVSPSLDNRKRQNQTVLYEEQYDIIGNEVNSRIGTVIDTRKRLKSHHAYHQRGGEEEDEEEREYHPSVPPTQQHSMISLSASLIRNTVSSHDEKNGQDTSLHDSFFREDESLCTHDTAASAALTEGTKSCEPKQKKSCRKRFSFEERFEELKAYKAKHGHCTVNKNTGDDKPLGRWCSKVRRSMHRIKNNEAPLIAGFSEDHIKRLEAIGFGKVKKQKKSYSLFEQRLEELEAYKAKHGHCDVNNTKGDNKPLGRWCSQVRRSMQRIMNNQAPPITGLSEDNIKRLEDIGFDWKVNNKQKKLHGMSFEERLEELETYKAKHGHCNVNKTIGDNKPLGAWCSRVRRSMQRIKNNRAPIIAAGFSEDNIKRLEAIGFDWKVKKQAHVMSFEERLEELETYKAKHGHCTVNKNTGDDKPLGAWCSRVRQSMQRIKNNQAPIIAAGFSEDNIKRLEAIGFEWKVKRQRKPYVMSFEERFEELEAYKAKHGHCDVQTRAGGNKPLGRWCSQVRRSMQRIKNNQAPPITGFSEDNIKRLEDIGFEWKVKKQRKPYVMSFEERFEELEAYKAKHGHCDVQTRAGDNKLLGRWCSKVRRSMQKIKNNQAPPITGFSEDNIKRLEDIGFH